MSEKRLSESLMVRNNRRSCASAEIKINQISSCGDLESDHSVRSGGKNFSSLRRASRLAEFPTGGLASLEGSRYWLLPRSKGTIGWMRRAGPSVIPRRVSTKQHRETCDKAQVLGIGPGARCIECSKARLLECLFSR